MLLINPLNLIEIRKGRPGKLREGGRTLNFDCLLLLLLLFIIIIIIIIIIITGYLSFLCFSVLETLWNSAIETLRDL